MATAKIPGKKTSAPAREPKITIKQFVALAARQVRKDSKDLTKPSMFEALRELAPDLVYIEQKDAVTGMNKNPRYEDIQSVTIYGSVYLYSDKYLDARRAAGFEEDELAGLGLPY